MHDKDGPQLAEWVYEYLLRNDTFDLEDVPYALDEAVQRLRKKDPDVPCRPSRWATFVHIGA